MDWRYCGERYQDPCGRLYLASRRARWHRVSRDLGGIPIRNFYFDGTQSDLDRDLGVYMELARSYQKKRG